VCVVIGHSCSPVLPPCSRGPCGSRRYSCHVVSQPGGRVKGGYECSRRQTSYICSSVGGARRGPVHGSSVLHCYWSVLSVCRSVCPRAPIAARCHPLWHGCAVCPVCRRRPPLSDALQRRLCNAVSDIYSFNYQVYWSCAVLTVATAFHHLQFFTPTFISLLEAAVRLAALQSVTHTSPTVTVLHACYIKTHIRFLFHNTRIFIHSLLHARTELTFYFHADLHFTVQIPLVTVAFCQLS